MATLLRYDEKTMGKFCAVLLCLCSTTTIFMLRCAKCRHRENISMPVVGKTTVQVLEICF